LRPRTGLQHAASSRRAPLVQAARAVPLRTRGERGGAVAVPSANIRCPRRGVPSVALQWRRVRLISSSKEMKLTGTFRFHSLQWFPFVFRFTLRGMVFTRGGADWKESIGPVFRPVFAGNDEAGERRRGPHGTTPEVFIPPVAAWPDEPVSG